MREILIDIGRLVRRLNRSTPTGVDRVVLAYAQGLTQRFGESVVPVDTLAGRVLRYREAFSRQVLAATAASWNGACNDKSAHPPLPSRPRAAMEALAGSLLSHRLSRRKETGGERPLFFCLDHRGLMPGGTVERLSTSGAADCVCLLHDLIPLTHPEYVVKEQTARHLARITTMARQARLVIANSQDTAEIFRDQLARAGLAAPEVMVAHLGIGETFAAAPPKAEEPAGRPYFVMLGTIEARKNHLLLLNLWRDMAERARAEAGAEARAEAATRLPELVIVGRRGWEAEAVFDMLDRCPALKGHVRELSDLPDTALRRLVDGAQALLFPSFAEGFGLPLAEALARGVPVIASDLAAFREIGAGVPELLDPLDGPGWRKAILDYAGPTSRRRAAQIARIGSFRPTAWETHLDAVCDRLGLG